MCCIASTALKSRLPSTRPTANTAAFCSCTHADTHEALEHTLLVRRPKASRHFSEPQNSPGLARMPQIPEGGWRGKAGKERPRMLCPKRDAGKTSAHRYTSLAVSPPFDRKKPGSLLRPLEVVSIAVRMSLQRSTLPHDQLSRSQQAWCPRSGVASLVRPGSSFHWPKKAA